MQKILQYTYCCGIFTNKRGLTWPPSQIICLIPPPICHKNFFVIVLVFCAIFFQVFFPRFHLCVLCLLWEKSSFITKEFVSPSPYLVIVTKYANFSEFSMHMYVLRYKSKCGHIWHEKILYMSVRIFVYFSKNYQM